MNFFTKTPYLCLKLLDAQLTVIQASSSLVGTKYDAAIQSASLDDLIGTLDRKYK
jgi:outer membrane protein TolC